MGGKSDRFKLLVTLLKAMHKGKPVYKGNAVNRSTTAESAVRDISKSTMAGTNENGPGDILQRGVLEFVADIIADRTGRLGPSC